MEGAGTAPKGAAFFDLDDTLLDVNSGASHASDARLAHSTSIGWLWLQHEWALGRISASQILHAVFCLVLYALGYVENLDAALETAVSYYANTDAGELRSQTEAWFAESVFPRTRPRAVLAVAEHKASGERVVLASSTTQFAAECARVAYGLDDAVFTSLEVKEGRLTGRIASLAFGRQKAARVREWASANGYSVSRSMRWTLQLAYASLLMFSPQLRESAFYSDSFADRQLLSEVGRPVCVNPDRRLRKLAAQRGWRVVDWGKSAAVPSWRFF